MNIFLYTGLIMCLGICIFLGWHVFQFKKILNEREKSYHLMHQDLHGLIHCMRGISLRFEKQQKQLRSVTVRQNDIHAMNTNDSNYEQAILLMDKGATVEDLIETCGLSKGEAELMNRINNIKFQESAGEPGLR